MAVATRLLTLDEFHALPDDGTRYELIDGEVFVGAAPNRKHFWTHRRLFNRLIVAVEDSGRGYVFYAPIEVRLGGPTAVEPDLFVLRKERLHLFAEDAVIGSPDLIVEVLSPSTRGTDLEIKRRRYERAGVLEYLIADPVADTLRVLVLQDGAYVEQEIVDGQVASSVVPDLIIAIAELFAPIG